MTTEELLWNAAFEKESSRNSQNTYNYEEEWAIEKYYQEKDLFEQIAKYIRPAS